MTRSTTSTVELPIPQLAVGPDSADYLDATFAACEQLARTHYENFSVGSRLLPKHLRRHFYSIYAFSRGVDDLGDEATGNRLALLDLWEQQLDLCYAGSPTHPYFVALAETIQQFDIPSEPFKRLIEANRRDQEIVRHQTYDDLIEYCTYSANPVGHLVLYLAGIRDPGLQTLADHTCTALQLANFWQDVARDHEIGRVYIPSEDMVRFGISDDQIASASVDEKFKSLMKFQVDRARALFSDGYPLIEHLDSTLKSDFAMFLRGGLAILQAIEKQDFDVLTRRPTISRFGKARIFGSTWLRSKFGRDLVPSSAFQSLAKRST